MRRLEMHVRFWLESLKGRHHSKMCRCSWEVDIKKSILRDKDVFDKG
jgi:hypothetical protein